MFNTVIFSVAFFGITRTCKMWTCDSCQKQNEEDSRFCKKCKSLRHKEEKDEFEDEAETGNVQKLLKKFDRNAESSIKQQISDLTVTSQEERHKDLFDFPSNQQKDQESSIKQQISDLTVTSQEERHKDLFDFPSNQQKDQDAGNYGIESNEIRMVAIGKTGTGKSATANTIVGINAFVSKAQGTGVTKKCQMEICNRFDKKFVYVDTPGIFDPHASNDKVKSEIVKCIGITSPGPHAFLYVVSISRFTKEDQDAVQYFVDHFGTGVYKYLIVVFTRIDDLENDGISIDEFVKDVPDKLKEILRLCGNRYIGFNNRLKGKESHLQVQLLLDKIESMVKSNGNQCYTNAIYKEAEETMRKRLDEMKKELEEKKKREEEELRKELSKQYEKEVSKSRENEERMKKEIKKLQLESQNISIRAEAVKIEISHLKRQLQSARERSDTQSENEIIERLQDMEMKLSELEKQIKTQLEEKEMKTKKEEEELNRITKQLEEETNDKTEKEMLEKKLKQLEAEKIENAQYLLLQDINPKF
ncbi:hypothetical protein KUTeg_006511 [Tegillarca granosa]|uniref:Uncharacterized protein n=1 Tax=Tegillarca granosa TaxID=220873 RepID=A0ABQ9FKN7_TEGGR|nr:hypothetical protein KUTeg_006511 [Tegillarca granosa]